MEKVSVGLDSQYYKDTFGPTDGQSTYTATTLGIRMNFVADPLEHGPRMPATIGPRVQNSSFARERDALDGLGLAVSVHSVGAMTLSHEAAGS